MSELEKSHIVDVMTNYFSSKHTRNEKRSLILLSLQIKESSKVFADSLQEQRFDEYILAVSEMDSEVEKYFARYRFKIIQSQGGKGKL